jgi:hypothetical protein
VPTSCDDNKNEAYDSLEFISRFLPQSREDTDASFNDSDFTRNRKLPLAITLALLINMVRPGKRFGYQEVINRFFSDTGLAHDKGSTPPDKAAFLRARKKVPFDVLSGLFEKAVEQATGLASSCGGAKWNGFRLVAIDGTKKNVPYSEELVQTFGVPHGAHYPQLLSCALFDVLLKIPLNLMWGAYDVSERTMALELTKDLGPGDLLLLDRGYPGFELFEKLLSRGIDFLVRLQDNGLFKPVSEFLAEGHRDGKITLHPPKKLVRQRLRNGEPAPEPIRLRVVKVKTKGNKTALFITTLTNKGEYPASALRELYHLRWEEEEFYKLIKELLEAENFRGKSRQFIDQEVMAIYLYCLLVRIMMMEAAMKHDIALSGICQQAAFLAVTRFMDKLLVSQTLEDCQHWLELCLTEISWQRYKKRTGRSFPRISKRSYGKWGRRSA